MLRFLTDHWNLEEFTPEQINKLLNIKDVVYSKNISTEANEMTEDADVDENIENQEDFE